MPGTLASLYKALEEATDYSIDSLRCILEQELPSWEEVKPLVPNGDPYGRVLLFHNENVEVMIGAWKRGDWCAAHDHGPSIGVCYSYSGQIEHASYELSGKELHMVERCTISDNAFLPLDLGMIHSLCNTSSDEPYVGLHIYSPPTRDVRVFDIESGNIYHITDDHGAWVPEDPSKIRKVEEKVFTLKNSVEHAITH